MRDTFRGEVKKTKKRGKNKSLDSRLKSFWTYYDDMLFLKDVLKTRRPLDFDESSDSITKSILTEEIVKIEPEIFIEKNIVQDDDDDYDNDDNKSVADSPHPLDDEEEVDVDSTETYQGKRKRLCEDNHVESDDDPDDDLLFFRSLLPFTKKLNANKKLLFRMNVQQMLYNQLYN